MALSKITIRINSGGFGTIDVNGVALHGVKEISFESAAGMPPIVTLALIAESIDVETEAIIAPYIISALEAREAARLQDNQPVEMSHEMAPRWKSHS